jgi:hypothetical protein
MDDELRQVDLQDEFPRWEFGLTINGRPRGRRAKTSPPVWLWADSWIELRDEVRAWETRRER